MIQRNDEYSYTNIGSSLQTPLEETITKIIADVLEAKKGQEVEVDSNHEEEEPHKPIVTKKKELELIDG